MSGKERQTNLTCQLWDAKTFRQKIFLYKRQIFRLNSCGTKPVPLWIGAAVRLSERAINRLIETGTLDMRTFETMQEAEI